jgi:hypothetical protein
MACHNTEERESLEPDDPSQHHKQAPTIVRWFLPPITIESPPNPYIPSISNSPPSRPRVSPRDHTMENYIPQCFSPPWLVPPPPSAILIANHELASLFAILELASSPSKPPSRVLGTAGNAQARSFISRMANNQADGAMMLNLPEVNSHGWPPNVEFPCQ